MGSMAAVRRDRSCTQHDAWPSGVVRIVAGDPTRVREIGVGKLGNPERQCNVFRSLRNQPGRGDRCFLPTVFLDQVARRGVLGVSRNRQLLRKVFHDVAA